jgi:hypothetical protein
MVCQAQCKQELGFPIEEVTGLLSGALKHLGDATAIMKSYGAHAITSMEYILRAKMWVAYKVKSFRDVIFIGTKLIDFYYR